MTTAEARRIVLGIRPFGPDGRPYAIAWATQLEAWRLLVRTGVVWDMSPYCTRRATALIEAGIIRDPRERHYA
jgi:hypothetical protein